MRITLAEYQGKPFISLRVWERGENGQLWPMRGKGCSLRMSEVEDVIDALMRVEDMVMEEIGQGRASGGHPPAPHRDTAHRPATPSAARPTPDRTQNQPDRPERHADAPIDDTPRYVDRRRRPAGAVAPFDPSVIRRSPPGAEDFDEFDDQD
jgi:hypothetical protein